MIEPHPDDELGLRLADDGELHPRQGPVAVVRSALTMLTRLPVQGGPAVGTGARAFGLVGAAIGLAGCVPLVVLGSAVPAPAAILAVATMAILSGGIHLDGLADTADALVAVGPGAAERARKDPGIGVGGAAALIVVLGLEAATLALLAAGPGPVHAGLTCVVGGAVSRIVPVPLGRLSRSRAGDRGLGAWFTQRTSAADAAIAVAIGLLLTLAVGLAASVALLAAGVVGGIGGLGLGLALVRVRGKLDGDLFGASVELAFATTLLAAATLASWPRS